MGTNVIKEQKRCPILIIEFLFKIKSSTKHKTIGNRFDFVASDRSVHYEPY